ncbi:MAG: rhomboid family intramembrane serine protease [Verrucomicrobiales bacterium]|nr:rhomboid family intramembrane serine protease [Verrucomicrobiales bacterium]
MTSPPSLPSDHRGEQVIRSIKDHLLLLIGIVAIAWGLETADTVLFGFLDRFGIQPRTISGLSGILTAPFLHLGFGHLISNTLPFLILGGVVLIGGRSVFIRASVFIIAIGGMMLWTLGPKATNHLGASLLIFGYLGFLLARGIFERSGFWILVSVLTLILYGGMLGGVLPGQPGISWQGHLFGFIAGVIAARVMCTKDQGGAISG